MSISTKRAIVLITVLIATIAIVLLASNANALFGIDLGIFKTVIYAFGLGFTPGFFASYLSAIRAKPKDKLTDEELRKIILFSFISAVVAVVLAVLIEIFNIGTDLHTILLPVITASVGFSIFTPKTKQDT